MIESWLGKKYAQSGNQKIKSSVAHLHTMGNEEVLPADGKETQKTNMLHLLSFFLFLFPFYNRLHSCR